MKDQLNKLKMRDWTETKAHSSWQIFKIMAEFVQGFENLAKIQTKHSGRNRFEINYFGSFFDIFHFKIKYNEFLYKNLRYFK